MFHLIESGNMEVSLPVDNTNLSTIVDESALNCGKIFIISLGVY
ncbi:MAG TPA: hypothetical protein VNS08_08560 [Ureibacillus sp.]|nr:hypothetical protein [Ureibacillus sp.]